MALQNLSFFDFRTMLLCFCFLLVLRWFFGQPKNLPPGPWGFPIIGSVPAIARGIRRGLQPHDLFGGYVAKYGPVFRLTILNKTLVVLNDYASVKEAFQHPQLNDRPKMLFTEVTKIFGVATASGEPWSELRRFCLAVFRSLGVGKSSFEEKISTEAEELLKEMAAFQGKRFHPKVLLSNAVSNVICSIIFGKRYEYTDEKFKKLLDIVGRKIKLSGVGGIMNFFPNLRHLLFFPTKELFSNFYENVNFLRSLVDARRAAFEPDNLRDFTDVFLMEIQQNRAKNSGSMTVGSSPKSATRVHLTESTLVGTIGNLFTAGWETTATTLQWCLLYMMLYPDIQQRVQAEIDAVVGRNRFPRMADKPELSFTEAVIWEVQRLACVTPLGIPHAAASDTHLHGFGIPKDTLLVPNLWAIFRDPKVWSEPDRFNPERFLNDEGKTVKPEELIPFGIGRRSCIGENLARMELFIFFSYFMHQFAFKKPHSSPPLSLKGRGGITYSPEPFDLCAVKRD